MPEPDRAPYRQMTGTGLFLGFVEAPDLRVPGFPLSVKDCMVSLTGECCRS